MPYPPNLNTSDPRSPEYDHYDRDEAMDIIDAARHQVICATEALYNAFSAWEDLSVTDTGQDDAAALAPRIAELAGAFPACLENGYNPVSLRIAGELLEMAQLLMTLRATTRSRYLHKDLMGHVATVRALVSAIKQTEAKL